MRIRPRRVGFLISGLIWWKKCEISIILILLGGYLFTVYIYVCFLRSRRPDIVARQLSSATELIVQRVVWKESRIKARRIVNLRVKLIFDNQNFICFINLNTKI